MGGEQWQPPGWDQEGQQPPGWQPDDSGSGGDTIPDDFSFVPQTGVALDTLITSSAVTLLGFDTTTTISVSPGAEYNIDGGAFTSADGTVEPNALVRVRVTSSDLPLTEVVATLTVGGVEGAFSVTTTSGAAAQLRVHFKLGSLRGGATHLIDSCFKDAASTLPVSIDCYSAVANTRRPNEQYDTGEYVRPELPNGFAYAAVQSGTGLTGLRPPRWPTTVGQQVGDGSVTWECAAPDTHGLSSLSIVSIESDPAGLVIDAQSVNEGTKIHANYSSGVVGQMYDVVFTILIDGLTFVARQTVNISRQ
jgi:hypothetical protein